MPSAAVRKRAERVVPLTSSLVRPAACRSASVRMNMGVEFLSRACGSVGPWRGGYSTAAGGPEHRPAIVGLPVAPELLPARECPVELKRSSSATMLRYQGDAISRPGL